MSTLYFDATVGLRSGREAGLLAAWMKATVWLWRKRLLLQAGGALMEIGACASSSWKGEGTLDL